MTEHKHESPRAATQGQNHDLGTLVNQLSANTPSCQAFRAATTAYIADSLMTARGIKVDTKCHIAALTSVFIS